MTDNTKQDCAAESPPACRAMLPIFSGEYSRDMWDKINKIDELSTPVDIGDALYLICCRLQELETHLERGEYTGVIKDGQIITYITGC